MPWPPMAKSYGDAASALSPARIFAICISITSPAVRNCPRHPSRRLVRSISTCSSMSVMPSRKSDGILEYTWSCLMPSSRSISSSMPVFTDRALRITADAFTALALKAFIILVAIAYVKESSSSPISEPWGTSICSGMDSGFVTATTSLQWCMVFGRRTKYVGLPLAFIYMNPSNTRPVR